MKLIVSAASLRLVARAVEAALIVMSVAAFAFCAITLTESGSFQHDQSQRLNLAVAGQPFPSLLPNQLQAKPIGADPGGLIGRIEIPRLHLSVIVMEGVDASTLKHAVGHIPGTSLPGGPGNVALSAHRDTFFRPLRDIRQGDLIRVITAARPFAYRVVQTKIVDPHDLTVLASHGHPSLTLVTCYPFYFIGPAPQRFIVFAEPDLTKPTPADSSMP